MLFKCESCTGDLEKAENGLYRCKYCGRIQRPKGLDKNDLNMLERGMMALEDRDYIQATTFFENALNANPRLAEAYLGKLMAELEVSSPNEIINAPKPLGEYGNFQKALRFANPLLQESLLQYEQTVLNKLNEKQMLDEQVRKQRYNEIIGTDVYTYQQLEELAHELSTLNILDSERLSTDWFKCAAQWKQLKQTEKEMPQKSYGALGCGTCFILFVIAIILFGVFDSFEEIVMIISSIASAILFVAAFIFLRKFLNKKYEKKKEEWEKEVEEKRCDLIEFASKLKLKIHIQ